MTPDEIIKLVTDSGLRGRGGAGFSAGSKWSFIPKEKKGPHYLAVNADESEPGTFQGPLPDRLRPPRHARGHRDRLDRHPVRRRLQLHTAASTTGRRKFLERALHEAYANGVFGQGAIFGSKHKLECYVHRGAAPYICGERPAC
jgi:NADH-quinone oxidoreductase subunit F